MRIKNKKAIKWISGGHFLIDMYSGFLNPILPFIAAHLGISLACASCIISISQITSSITQPLFGFFADRFKRRFFLFWGMILAAIFLSTTTIAPNLFVLSMCIIFGSMGVSFFHPQASGMTNYFCIEANVTKKMSIYLTCGTFGFALGPIVSSFIVDFISFKALPFMAIFGILYALSLFVFVPKIKTKKTDEPLPEFKNVIFEIFCLKTTRLLVILSIIKALIQVTFLVLMPFLWKSLNYPPSKIGIIIFLFLTIGSIGTMLSSKMEKTFGTKITMILSLVMPLPLTLLFVLTYLKLPFLSIAAFLIIGFFIMLSTPINMTLAQKVMPEYKSTIAGLIGGFSFGVIGLFLPLVGYFAQMLSIPKMLLILSLIPAILSFIVNMLPDNILYKKK